MGRNGSKGGENIPIMSVFEEHFACPESSALPSIVRANIWCNPKCRSALRVAAEKSCLDYIDPSLFGIVFI